MSAGTKHIDTKPYQPRNKIRIVTAASLFDGHDAAINIMRRIMQASGAEVIHLGHNRSVAEIVDCAIQEDAQAIAITSYQGGHMEFFKYMYDLLQEKGGGHIRIVGGGGGTILPSEIEELQEYGIARIYHPDDGRAMGLQGMINDVLQIADFPRGAGVRGSKYEVRRGDVAGIAELISIAENAPELFKSIQLKSPADRRTGEIPILGITGTGGAGKSSLTDELVRRFLLDFPDKTLAIISVDPSRRKTGGALLGDRIRMNAIYNPRVFMRSMATRQSNAAVSASLHHAIDILKAATFDMILVETSGIGQSGSEIVDIADVSLYVMTPEFGAASQLEKIDMLDFADVVAINKFDKRGAVDALRDVRKQYQRNRNLWNTPVENMPVFGSIASQFNDPGTNELYKAVIGKVIEKTGVNWASSLELRTGESEKVFVIPPSRVRYLSDITDNNRKYDAWVKEQSKLGNQLFGLQQAIQLFGGPDMLQNVQEAGSETNSPPPGEGGTKGGGQEYLEYSGRNTEIFNHPNLKYFRRELRNNPTPAESELWNYLKNRQLDGRKFRRQHSVGPYILDFYCPEERLAIELDGDVHFNPTAEEYDQERTKFINYYGIKVIRFENKEVFNDLDYVLDEIRKEFNSPPLPPLEGGKDAEVLDSLMNKFRAVWKQFDRESRDILLSWQDKKLSYSGEYYTFKVRDREIKVKTNTESLSHLQIPRVSLPRYAAWGDILQWNLQENVPGAYPYTAGVFPFKRENEDPTRMFAGEGGPERTNKRFHYVSLGMPAKRLSTAFDSVTLYGEDPATRPDIYGKIGNSGVSICTLDDAKKLYSGFDLCDPTTSVSMTINGPAATICAFFMNAAIDQQCEKYIREHGLEEEVKKKIAAIFKDKGARQPVYHGKLPEGNDGLGLMLLGVTGDQVLPKEVYSKIKAHALSQVRGTVQADILKEDQAQNTCIFSTEFSLKLMGDVQEYFVQHKVRNFYSVSISGYHMAEAGANPITQLAFTLANGFSFVEYYLSRGMRINDFAPNLSFFFSNGIDPEYAVIGRVARRIWAKAMKHLYKANERSQKLKYHIQTSGRSLHAQEIDFNDIRTTLQALYAIYDNCNSLHTNAFDEAITTPTEHSVRRAMAIQLIINKELGLAKNENPLQGSFIIEELTDLVEEAVYAEFDRLTERGGVLGAMETMYQRGKIQEESMYYEMQKHTGQLPIIGVNTFLSSKGSPTIIPGEVIRATEEEKQRQIANLEAQQQRNAEEVAARLQALQQATLDNKNLFEVLIETVKYCSLGQITHALYEVGGQYRRNM